MGRQDNGLRGASTFTDAVAGAFLSRSGSGGAGGAEEETAPVKSSFVEGCVSFLKEREGHCRDLSREKT